MGRAVSIKGNQYPEISNYVPNAFVEDWRKISTFSLRGISKTRHCQGKNFSSRCIDGVLDIDFNFLNKEKFSLYPKFTIQSLTNRGTKIGETTSLGFKAAFKTNEKWSFAIGGENIIHFDNKIDLGKNFYLVSSTYYPLFNKKNENPAILFLNAGIGSDFYGYKGNGFIGSTYCFGTNTLTGNGRNLCTWGPIGSIALAFNDRFALVSEWFGYSYGVGLSFKPLANKNVGVSFYATDFIQGFPKYAKEGCPDNKCSTRFYGNVSFHF